MKTIMFTRDNALRFWSHNKETTIRAAGKSGKPRHRVGEPVSLRIWTGKAYRSPTFEFGTAVVSHVVSVFIEGNFVRIDDQDPLKELGKKLLANCDGFDSWEELKTALNLHHGDSLIGFRYCFTEIDLKLTREALKELKSKELSSV